MNTDLRKAANNYYEKHFFRLKNNFLLLKNYGKFEKPQKYQTCNNKKGETTWCQKQIINVFNRKFIGCGNDKNSYIYK